MDNLFNLVITQIENAFFYLSIFMPIIKRVSFSPNVLRALKGEYFMKSRYDVVIIGAGPAGIFTALELTKLNENLEILIVDKGRTIEKRTCPARKTGLCINCNPCSITSGWSGAGAFSDGKLSKSPLVGGRITDYMSDAAAQKMID